MDEGHNRSKEMLKELEKALGKLYGTAAVEVQTKFEKHMRDIAPKKRSKQVDLRLGKISEEEYNKWLLGQIAIGKRWNEMKQTLAEDFSNVHKIAEQMIGDSNKEVYALNHNYGTYEAEHGSGVNTSYTLYDKHTVERLIKENPDVLPTPKVGDPRWDKRKFQEGIAQGIVQGESIPKVAKRVVLGTMEGDMKKAVRNARTATTSAQNGGRLNSYKRAADMGIKLKKTWMATDDSFTRQSHIDVDGETIPINETFSNECDYPGDPGGPPAEVWNCRCTMIADVDKASPSDKLPKGSFFDKALTKERYLEWEKEHNPRSTNLQMQIKGDVPYGKYRDDENTALRSFLGLPSKVRNKFINDIKYDVGHDTNSCNWIEIEIRVGVNADKEGLDHEAGHLVEHYMMDKQKVDEYKRYLTENVSRKDIYPESYINAAGEKTEILIVHGDRFVTEYQGRIYADSVDQCYDDKGNLRLELMEETISEPFKLYLNHPEQLPKDEKGRLLIEEVVK